MYLLSFRELKQIHCTDVLSLAYATASLHCLSLCLQRDLLGFLAQLTGVPAGQEAVASVKQEVPVEDRTATEPSASVVGPTTAELESCKELIQFDHVYYKAPSSVHIHQPPVAQAPCRQAQQSLLKPIASESSRMSSDVDRTISDVDRTISDVDTMLTSSGVGSMMDFELNINDFMELSDSLDQLGELEALLDDDLCSPCQPESVLQTADVKQEYELIVIPDDDEEETTPKHCKSDCKKETDAITVLETSEICVPDESYELLSHLERQSTSSNESGYSSDLSDVSPKSEISSTQSESDYLWEDSFTELFPSLL